MGHSQMIPNKLMMRQDDDTDNEPPAATDGSDSMKQFEDQRAPQNNRGEKVGSRQSQAQLHPKELPTEGDCDMNDEGDNSENVINETPEQTLGANQANENQKGGTKKPANNRIGNNQVLE